MKTIRRALKTIFNKIGFDLRRFSKEVQLRTTLGDSFMLLKQLGCRPETVMDIGVASGTKELYETYSDATFLLIEPLIACEPYLKSILKQYKGYYKVAAAGSKKGTVIFNVHDDQLSGSSLLKETMGSEADGHEITIPMVTIDDMIEEKKLKGPYLIKVDVQGAELEVLNGAKITLQQTLAVALEVSLFEFMKGAPQLADVIIYMKEIGFVAWDILIGWNRPLDNALGQIDIVFVQENGMFRETHAYSN
jgi:FkbM family methyltransferase